MTPLSLSSTVAHGSGFAEAEVRGEIVALNIDKGTCYGLNRIGSRIWALTTEPRSVGAICTALLSEYDVDRATCEAQVLDLLEELRREGLVELRQEPAGSRP